MKVTIKEVALRAAVSPSTVSRVIHDNPRISQATKRRVWAAMEELGYHPHALASGLAGRPTRTIGLILPNAPEELFANPFFIQAMRGISIHAQANGYFLMYGFSQSEDEEIQFLQRYLRSRWVEGIILLTVRQDDHCIQYLQNEEFPFAVIGRPENSQGILWVDNDNFKAAYDAVNLLMDRGARRVAFVGGPLTFTVTHDRRAGYEQALRNRGIEPDLQLVCSARDFTEEEGHRCMTEIMKTGKPDAVLATDDLLAFGAGLALQTADRKALLVGFNNTARGGYQRPTLSSVDINPGELGRRVAELLIDRLEGRSTDAQHFVVPTHLVERETTLALDPVPG